MSNKYNSRDNVQSENNSVGETNVQREQYNRKENNSEAEHNQRKSAVSQNTGNYGAYYGKEHHENSHCPNCNTDEEKQKPKEPDTANSPIPYAQGENYTDGTPLHRGEQEYFPALHDE